MFIHTYERGQTFKTKNRPSHLHKLSPHSFDERKAGDKRKKQREGQKREKKE